MRANHGAEFETDLRQTLTALFEVFQESFYLVMISIRNELYQIALFSDKDTAVRCGVYFKVIILAAKFTYCKPGKRDLFIVICRELLYLLINKTLFNLGKLFVDTRKGRFDIKVHRSRPMEVP